MACPIGGDERRNHEMDGDDDSASWIPIEMNAADLCGIVASSGREEQISRPRSVRSLVVSKEDKIELSSRPRSSGNLETGLSTYRSVSPSGSLRDIHVRDSTDESLKSIQRKLETRQSLREGLLDHPLSQLPGKFASHLLRELWNRDAYVRVGLMLTGFGSLMQAVSFANIILLHKQAILAFLLFVVSYLLLSRVDKKAQSVVHLISSWKDPSKLIDSLLVGLERLDAARLRRFFFFFALTPSLLEMRAVAFLTATVVEGGWLVNGIVTLAISTYVLYLKSSGVASSQCSVRSMVCLYCSALVVAVGHIRDLRRTSTLAAPFVLAAGSLVLSESSGGGGFEWLSREIRHSLRLSLRDILVDVGGNVMEDEMLQLAMLRWIVDYWSSAPDVDHSSAEGGDCVSSSTVRKDKGQPELARDRLPISNESIGWEQMTCMLQMTTNQMQHELYQQSDEQNKSRLRQPSQSRLQPENRSFETGNVSLENLKSVLASLDVDARAKPAVQSYKATVENIPPTRNVALLVALMRRCPSIFSLLFWHLLGSRKALGATVTLLPLIGLEITRVREWARSCSKASAGVDSYRAPNRPNPVREQTKKDMQLDSWLPPSSLDNVIIMLSPDLYNPNNPSQLIQVWLNMKSSVIALERSLTAVRYVHTTCAATELTFNIVSLTKLGVEVCHKGWGHGLSVIAQDILHFIGSNSSQNMASWDMRSGGNYTAAAVSAVQNSRVIARNVSMILEEEGGNRLVDCVLNMIAASCGRGWIWGKWDFEKSHQKCLALSRDLRGKDNSNEIENEQMSTGTSRTQTEYCRATQYAERALIAERLDCSAPSEIVNRQPFCIHSCSNDPIVASPLLKVDSSSVEPVVTPSESVVCKISGHVQEKNNNTDGSSDLFERIAEAVERGLITEQDKNDLLEMLLMGRSDNSATSAAGMERRNIGVVREKIECLFLESSVNDSGICELEEKHADSPKMGWDLKEGLNLTSCVSGNECKIEESAEKGTACSQSESAPLQMTCEPEGSKNCVISENLTVDNDTDSVEEAVESLSVSPCDGSDKATAYAPRHFVDNVCNSEDEASWTEIGAAKLNGLGESTKEEIHPTQSKSDMVSEEKPLNSCPMTDCEDRDDDWIKWAGGGLALLGAVVGGIALVNANNRDKDSDKEKASKGKEETTNTA